MSANDPCTWCGSVDYGCDCITRMDCPYAGQPGHLFCGRHPCGCPKFWSEGHSCPVQKLDAPTTTQTQEE